MIKQRGKGNHVQVIYLSRTHHQLENVVREFRKQEQYERQITILTMGSCDKMGSHRNHCMWKRKFDSFAFVVKEALTMSELVKAFEDAD
jgi:hypothetical protein